MEAINEIDGYVYADAETNQSHAYLLPATIGLLRRSIAPGAQVFDLGCGNGSVSAAIANAGYEVQGVDPSEDGIAQANAHYPKLRLERGSAYDDLAQVYGQHDAVVSLEVVEHVYSPRKYAATLYALLKDGGTAIVSTPYHGYAKNVALAVTGRLDKHFTALWDHGHIKFWSRKTLSELLREAGFKSVTFERVGRIPAFAKSMIAIATK